jgi:hypothetical protein
MSQAHAPTGAGRASDLLLAAKAGALYAIVIFLIGFIVGTIRVVLLVSRLGETTAVIVEAPLMPAAS